MKLCLYYAALAGAICAAGAAATHHALRGKEDEGMQRLLAPAQKVKICHIPPGNPDNFHTISVSKNAVKAHLDHGDFLGSCDEHCDELCDDDDKCTIDYDASAGCEDAGCYDAPRPPKDCDDGVFCNGVETCDSDQGCLPGTSPCDDGVECTVDTCDEATKECTNSPDDGACGDENECTIDTCDAASGCVYTPLDLRTYTTSSDFDEGQLINVDSTQVPDQLQLNNDATPFNFIWIAASGRGTVVKIDTLTGAILGEYRTTPGQNGDPSRTTVDSDGSVWVANRNTSPGSVVHIGLVENGQCEDRNGNGVIDTSTGLTDIKGWSDLSGTRSVATAEDECIVSYTAVSSTGTRHVSVTPQNNIWVSGTGGSNWDLVTGGNVNEIPDSGVTILKHYDSVGYGGYGGLEDANGVIWSARSLLRWDTANDLTGSNGDPSGNSIGPPLSGTNWSGQFVFDSYGLCVDPDGNVWNTQLSGNRINKYASDGTFIGSYAHGNDNAQGCVADAKGDIWVAHALWGAPTVGHLSNDGTHIGNVNLAGGSGPTGVAVDGAGKVWSANIVTHTASRIDPTLAGGVGAVDLTVNLGSGASPYNYSDMTGSTLIAPPNSGSWTVIYDSEVPGKNWGGLDWEELTPDDSELTVMASSSTDGTTFSTPELVSKSTDLSVPDGQYLKVVVSFKRATSEVSPILYDLTVLCQV